MAEQISNHLTDDVSDDVQAAITSLRAETPAEPVKEAPEPTEAPVEDKAAAPGDDKPADDRPRDESGRFVKTGKDDAPAKPVEVKPPQPERQGLEKIDKDIAAATAPAAKAIGNPPAGWSVKAKSQWDRLPEVVRQEIAQAATGDYDGLKPYAERARANGQTLAQVFGNYVGFEDTLRQNPQIGFMNIAQNLGLTQHQAGQMFGQLAQNLGWMPQGAPAPTGHPASPEQANGQAAIPAELQQLLAPHISPLAQRLAQLEGTFRQQTEAIQGQRQQGAMSAVESFRSDPAHRYYDNLETVIGDLLEKGVVRRTGDMQADLKTAYDMACRLDPEVSELLTTERIEKAEADKRAKEQEAAAKARAASRSVTGSPSPGASEQKPRSAGQSYDDDLYADVKAAVQAASGRA